ncbi:MAG: hypothetical protein KAG61_07880, partial [Bacteriovoracaceae bacterium]|nr:hypothetical protein [Bacteriovoracaceae bacterium]
MKKTLITFIGIASAVVMAKSLVDANFYASNFMNDSEIKVVKRLDDSHVRYVASYDLPESKKINFPVNGDNSALINKTWKITNYTYNFGAPEAHNRNYDLELVGNGRVMIAGDTELVYEMISFNGNSISLIKEVDGGTEMIEAEVVATPEMAAAKYETEEELEVISGVQGVKIEEDYNLVLTKAESPGSKKVEVVTSASLAITTEGTVTSFVVEGEDIVTYEIKVGGLFNGEFNNEMISGRISNGIKKGQYRVRFFTGSLKGQVLHFDDENTYEAPEVEE